MKIGIDARTITSDHITGIGTYVLQLVLELSKKHTLILFADQKPTGSKVPISPNITWAQKPARHRWWWEIIVLPKLLHQHPVDVYHATWNYGAPKNVPTVTTIHDLIPLVLPDLYQSTWRTKIEVWIIKILTKQSIRRSRAIIAVSHTTAQDIEKIFPEARGKIQVIYEGVELLVPDVGNSIECAPYFIYIGGFEKRKNISLLLQAFREFHLSHPETELLLIGSRNTYFTSNITPLLFPGVKTPGYVASADLPKLLSQAIALIYPSLYEGFGFPVLEAMSAGTPVLAAHNSSISEIAGSAAHFFNPYQVASLRSAMEELYSSPALGETLRQAGYAQSKKFPWSAMINATEAIYDQVIIKN